jgi:hypothetical protein
VPKTGASAGAQAERHHQTFGDVGRDQDVAVLVARADHRECASPVSREMTCDHVSVSDANWDTRSPARKDYDPDLSFDRRTIWIITKSIILLGQGGDAGVSFVVTVGKPEAPSGPQK